jgi:hypothetical protein
LCGVDHEETTMSIVGKWDVTGNTDMIGVNPIAVGDWVEITAGRPDQFDAYTGNTLNFSIPVTINGNSIKGDGRSSTDGNYYYVTANLKQVGGADQIFGAVLKKSGADDDGGQWDGNRKP